MRKFVPLLLLLAACQGKFNGVKVGMHSKDVISLVGEPDRKDPMGIGTAVVWNYEKEGKILFLLHDTVAREVLDLKALPDSIKNAMGAVKERLDSLQRSKYTIVRK